MNKLMEEILKNKNIRNREKLELLAGSEMSAGSPWAGEE